MPIQRVNFFQRNSAGAPLVGGTITTTSRYDDNTAGPVIGNAIQLSAVNQPGFYYFDVDVDATKRLTVVTDAGGVVTGNNRYNSFVLDDIDPTARRIAKQVWDDLTIARNTPGSFGLALGTTMQTSIAAIPDATDISDAVWDAPQINHQDSGTFGLLLNGLSQATSSAVWGADASIYGGGVGTIMGDLMVSSAADVWDKATSAHVGIGTFGYTLGTKVPDDVDAIPGEVWNIPIASHLIAGSTGKTLNDLATASTPAGIATAVWAALVASNQAVGSFGQAVTIMQALAHRNWRLTGATYSGSPARLTAATLVLYPTKADALASTNAILTQAFTATYNANGEMTASLQTDL